jgi:hypothetical protein
VATIYVCEDTVLILEASKGCPLWRRWRRRRGSFGSGSTERPQTVDKEGREGGRDGRDEDEKTKLWLQVEMWTCGYDMGIETGVTEMNRGFTYHNSRCAAFWPPSCSI